MGGERSWLICGANVLTPLGWQEYDVNVVDGYLAPGAPTSSQAPGNGPIRGEVLDATGLRLVPGFIDLQVNGGWGYDLQSEPGSLWALGRHLVELGVTTFLPTLTTNGLAHSAEALQVWRAGPPEKAAYAGADALGWHLEGPWLAPSRHGAHRRELLRPVPDTVPADYAPTHGVRMVTLAPELTGAVSAIRKLTERGVVVSCGHSEATVAQAQAAFEAGATMGTHLFNAMSGLHHRTPGLAAALLIGNVYLGLVVDGAHVAPEMVKLAWWLGRGRIVTVSDAVPALGTDPSPAGAGQPARLPDGTLAGATVGLDTAVRNLMTFTGCDLAEALAAVSEVPARCLGLRDRGRIQHGQRADLVGLDPDGNVVLTLVAGLVAYDRR